MLLTRTVKFQQFVHPTDPQTNTIALHMKKKYTWVVVQADGLMDQIQKNGSATDIILTSDGEPAMPWRGIGRKYQQTYFSYHISEKCPSKLWKMTKTVRQSKNRSLSSGLESENAKPEGLHWLSMVYRRPWSAGRHFENRNLAPKLSSIKIIPFGAHLLNISVLEYVRSSQSISRPFYTWPTTLEDLNTIRPGIKIYCVA